MRTPAVLIMALLVCFAALQCSQTTESDSKGNSPSPTPINLSQAEESLLNSSNQFGFKLFREILESSGDGDNVFISPLSASYALAMCYNGAAGGTRDAIAGTLELSGLSVQEVNEAYRSLTTQLTGLDPDVEVKIANSFWYAPYLPVTQGFKDLNQTYFDALVRDIDFGQPWAADTINGWVKANTRDRIDGIVTKPVDPSMIAILLNAIYFKGSWTVTFDTAATEEYDFHLADGSVIRRDLMLSDTVYGYYENDLFQAVDKPYGNGDFSMTVLLPQKDKSLDDILAELTAENWALWTGRLEADTVELYLPRFKLAYEVTLNQMLQAMGMQVAFTPGADFSNMVTGGGLWIDQVKQKSFVQVDEEGTEAAAVTAVVFITSIEPGNPIVFIDRPFLFAVRERVSGTVMFIGRIADPEWDDEA